MSRGCGPGCTVQLFRATFLTRCSTVDSPTESLIVSIQHFTYGPEVWFLSCFVLLINLGTLQNWYAWQTKVTYWSTTPDPDCIEINNKNNWLSYEINEVHSMSLEWNVFPREIFPVLLPAFKIWVARCTQLFLSKQMSPPPICACMSNNLTYPQSRQI